MKIRAVLQLGLFSGLLIFSICHSEMTRAGELEVNKAYFPDMLIVEPVNLSQKLKIRVSGPAGYFQKYSQAVGPVTLGIFDNRGQLLTDGLYQYEILPLPLETNPTVTIENSSPRREANRIRQARHISPIIGAYRILNGQIVLPQEEASNPAGSQEVVK